MIRAVLFDVGGTLMISYADPGSMNAFCALLLERLHSAGIPLDLPPAALGAAIRRGAADYKCHALETNRELPQEQIWNEYYLRSFSIGQDRLAPIAEDLSVLYDAVRLRNVPRPRLPEILGELESLGLRLGVISNVISHTFTRRLLADYGVADKMECLLLSSETTWRKPDPHNFRLASQMLGIGLEEMAYVGDTLSRDVLGCRNAGVGLCIQITTPEAVPADSAFVNSGLQPDVLITSLDELPGIFRARS
jgi:putative hydrolase of the HAD superfamily